MNFEFSTEQDELRAHVARMLEKSCPLDGVRAALGGDAQPGSILWRQLAELGYVGLCVPEALGGAGYTRLEQCILAEELGRVLAPVSSVGALYLFTELLLACGTEEQLERLLPEVVSGALIGAFGGHEGLLQPLQAHARFDASSGTVTGEKWPAIDAMAATHILVTAIDDTGAPGLYLVTVADPQLLRTELESFDPSRPLSRLSLSGAAAEKLGNFSVANYQRAMSNAAVFIAFEQLGLAAAAMYQGRDYALERRAFGRVIGSYQAVKHRLVDIYARIEIARTHAYYAAWAIEHQNTELASASRLAVVACNDAANFASRESIVVHGGYGFTLEAPCHLYLKRAQQTSTLLGSGAAFRQQIFDDMLETARGQVAEK